MPLIVEFHKDRGERMKKQEERKRVISNSFSGEKARLCVRAKEKARDAL